MWRSASPWSFRKRGGFSASAPTEESLTTCSTPAAFAASTIRASVSGWSGSEFVRRKSFRTPRRAASTAPTSAKSPTTASPPASRIACAFPALRTSARNGVRPAESSRTSSRPIVPVAPVTRIMGPRSLARELEDPHPGLAAVGLTVSGPRRASAAGGDRSARSRRRSRTGRRRGRCRRRGYGRRRRRRAKRCWPREDRR